MEEGVYWDGPTRSGSAGKTRDVTKGKIRDGPKEK